MSDRWRRSSPAPVPGYLLGDEGRGSRAFRFAVLRSYIRGVSIRASSSQDSSRRRSATTACIRGDRRLRTTRRSWNDTKARPRRQVVRSGQIRNSRRRDRPSRDGGASETALSGRQGCRVDRRAEGKAHRRRVRADRPRVRCRRSRATSVPRSANPRAREPPTPARAEDICHGDPEPHDRLVLGRWRRRDLDAAVRRAVQAQSMAPTSSTSALRARGRTCPYGTGDEEAADRQRGGRAHRGRDRSLDFRRHVQGRRRRSCATGGRTHHQRHRRLYERHRHGGGRRRDTARRW